MDLSLCIAKAEGQRAEVSDFSKITWVNKWWTWDFNTGWSDSKIHKFIQPNANDNIYQVCTIGSIIL